MYFGLSTGIETGPYTEKLTNQYYELYWEGIVFYLGLDEGKPTMQALLARLDARITDEELVDLIRDLRGNWVLFLFDILRKRWFVCSDHSHQNFLFFTSTSVSNSFLRLQSEQPDKTNVEEDALLTYLYCGHCYMKSIFYSNIQKLDYHDYFIIDETGIKISSKKLRDCFTAKDRKTSFVKTLNTLFSSLSKHRLCLDLSGGTDTRALLLALFHLGIDFDVATWGDRTYSEVQIATKVAKLIGKDLRFADLPKEDMSPDDLKSAWIACDGLSLALESYKFEKWRAHFGYSITIAGSAGELYKDGGWYRAALRNCMFLNGQERFIKQLFDSGEMLWEGMPLEIFESILAPQYRGRIMIYLKEMSQRLIKQYSEYPILESSDRIFFDFSINRLSGTGNSIIPRYLPLYEPEMINVGVSQPPWKRLSHNLYRQECGKLNHEVAIVETDRIGLTLSHKFIDILLESMRYLHAYASEKLGNGLPSYKTPNRNNTVILDYLMNHEDIQNGIDNLKDRGVLNNNVTKLSLNPSLAKRLASLYYLMS